MLGAAARAESSAGTGQPDTQSTSSAEYENS